MIKFDDGLIQGYIDHENKRVHFYGAWQIEDWFKVSQFWPKKWRGIIGVHSGFADLADRAFLIKELPTDWEGWTISGHSMGGAIAVLLGYITGCPAETAGCPRIGLFTAWQLGKKRHVRYINRFDPIQRLPFAFFGFRHFGIKVVLESNSIGFDAHEPAEYQKQLPWVTYP